MIRKTFWRSPLGWTEIGERDGGIVSIGFTSKPARSQDKSPLLERAVRELQTYFKNRREKFSFKLKTEGTPFQSRVWKELLKIPCGSVVSYKDIARRIGRPRAFRAVGSAVGKNKIMICIPCHRVVGSGGRLGGYAYGAQKKRWLLKLEKAKGLRA